MPYRRRRQYRRPRRRKMVPYRRRYRRRRPRRNRIQYSISRTIAQPDTFYVKLKYNQLVQKSPATFVYSHQFRGNSVFDPDFTSGGGQPVGFDQYATLYMNYQVLGSSIKVRLVNESAVSCGMVVYPSITSTLVTYDEGIGNVYSKNIVVGPLTGNNIRGISNFIRTKKLIGRSVDSVNYGASITTNPASPWYWNIEGRNMDGVTNIDATLQVQLVYYVKFWNRATIVDV